MIPQIGRPCHRQSEAWLPDCTTQQWTLQHDYDYMQRRNQKMKPRVPIPLLMAFLASLGFLSFGRAVDLVPQAFSLTSNHTATQLIATTSAPRAVSGSPITGAPLPLPPPPPRPGVRGSFLTSNRAAAPLIATTTSSPIGGAPLPLPPPPPVPKTAVQVIATGIGPVGVPLPPPPPPQVS
jgi:hypothetical protein